MKTTVKRLLALLMVLMMVFDIAPTTSSLAEQTNTTSTTESGVIRQPARTNSNEAKASEHTVTLEIASGISTENLYVLLRQWYNGNCYYRFAKIGNNNTITIKELKSLYTEEKRYQSDDDSTEVNVCNMVNIAINDGYLPSNQNLEWKIQTKGQINSEFAYTAENVEVVVSKDHNSTTITIGESNNPYTVSISGIPQTITQERPVYFVKATVQGEQSQNYYAQITGAGSVDFGENASNLKGEVSVSIVNSQYEPVSLLEIDGSEYIIQTPESATSRNFEFVATKRETYEINYEITSALSQDGGTEETYYYAIARNGNTFVAYVLLNGSEIILKQRNNNNSESLIYNDTSFTFLKTTNNTLDFNIDPNSVGTPIANGEKDGLYTFSWNVDNENKKHVIRVEKDPTYTASLTFDPADNVTLGSGTYYLLVKGSDSSYLYYAPLTSTGFGQFKDTSNTAVTEMIGVAGFEIVRTDNNSATLNDLTGLNKIENGGTLGEYYTVIFPTVGTDTALAFTATKQKAHSAAANILGQDGQPVGTDFSIDSTKAYYLVAKIGEQDTFAAPITGSGDLAFTKLDGTDISYLPKIDSFELVSKDTTEPTRGTAISLDGANRNQNVILGSDGTQYLVTLPVTANDPDAYTMTAQAIAGENQVIIDFVDDGQPDNNASLEGNYYLGIAVNNYTYFAVAKIDITGSRAVIDSFKGQDNSTYTINDQISNIQYLGIYTYPDGNLSGEYFAQNKDNDSSGKLVRVAQNANQIVGAYVITKLNQQKGNDKNFHITFTKRKGYTVNLLFKDATQQNAIIPGESGTKPITDYSWIRAELYDADGKFAGYAIQPTSTNKASNSVLFDEFKLFDSAGSTSEQQNRTISWTAAKNEGYYVESVRLIHKSDSGKPSNYTASLSCSQADFDGYTFASNRRNNYVDENNKGDAKTATSSTITIRVADPSEYWVKIDCGETPLRIPNSVDLYALVEITNSSGGNTYGYAKIDTSEAAVSYQARIADNQWWLNSNYGQYDKIEKNQISGHEQQVKVYIAAVAKDTKVDTPASLIDNKIGLNGTVQTHYVSNYPIIPKDYDPTTETGTEMRTIVNTPGVKTVYTDIVHLEKNEDQFDLYTLEKILGGGYNIITLCPGTNESMPKGVTDVVSTVGQGDAFIGCHQMGSVLIRGDVTFAAKVTGIADSPDADNPSVVGGYFGRTTSSQCFVNNRTNNEDHVDFYLGSSNSVIGYYINGTKYGQALGGVWHGINYPGETYVSDDFVDWNRLQRTIRDGSRAMLAQSTKTITATDGSTVNVDLGDNVTISCAADAHITVNIIGANAESPTAPGTIINFTNTENANVPYITVNGNKLDTTETGEGISIVYNYPNATGTVTGPNDSEFGHVVAPKALVRIEGGNYSGTMIGNNAYIGADAEGHLYPYRGNELIGFYGDIGLEKLVNNGEPSSKQKFTFDLLQLRNEVDNAQYAELIKQYGNDNGAIFWEGLQSVNNSGSTITFADVSFDHTGKYYFLMREDNTKLKSNQTGDDTLYLIECEVKNRIENQKSILYMVSDSLKYYKVNSGVTLSNLITVSELKNDEQQQYGWKAEIDNTKIERLNGSLSWNNSNGKINTDIRFLNTEGEVGINFKLEGVKTVENEDFSMEAGQFTFKVYENNKVVSTGINKANGDINFTSIRYSLKEFESLDENENEIIHTYTVKEVIPAGATAENGYTYNGITYDTKVYTVKVKVTCDDDNNLSAEVIEPKNFTKEKLTFINNYTAAIIKAKKDTSGEIGDRTFSFELYKEGTVKPIQTKGPVPAGEEVQFDCEELYYDYTDVDHTYTYHVKEFIPEGAVEKTGPDGKTYKVKDGVWYSTVGEEQTKTPHVFKNFYKAEATAKVQVAKHLIGRKLKTGEDAEFSFTLSSLKDAPLKDENGRTIETASLTIKNGADGVLVDFPTLYYSLYNIDSSHSSTDAGQTYYYKITEDEFNIPGVSKDTVNGPTEIYVKVQVGADNGEGKLGEVRSQSTRRCCITTRRIPRLTERL